MDGPPRRLRILHAVEFYAPSRGGAQEVVRRISEGMAARGHDVTVATTKLAERTATRLNGVKIREFDVAGNAIRGIRGDSYGYQRFLVEEPFDVIMSYAAQQWTTDLLLDVADEISSPVICAPCGYSGLRDPVFADYFAALPGKLRRLDATIYHSSGYQDIEFARSNGLENLHVIPNGASESEFAQRDERLVAAFREEHRIRGPMLLTVGSHSGTKGHRQCLAAFALADTGPATLVINGDGRRHSGCTDACRRLSRALGPLLAARGKRVVMTDLDRAALVTAFHAADLFVLLSRIECSPVVLYEALAARTPFISSDTGNAREIARQTGGGEIVRTLGQPQSRPVADPLAAVRAIERLLGDSARRADMAEAGHAAWRRRFTWERLTDDYLAVYDEVMTRRAPLPLGTGS